MSTKRREYEYGQIVSVDVVPLGDNLAADVSAGASSITVEDASDFDEDGGSLLLAGTVYTYSTWTEDDATGIGTISLTGATLAANAFEGDAVAVYDPLYLVAASDKVAQIAVVGDDGNVDMLEAAIALHLVDKIDEGVRGPNGEQVKLELEGDEWVVVDIEGLGNPNASGIQFKRDAMTVVTAGAQSFALTYEPRPDSLHLRWEPINLDDTEWTLAGKVVTIPTPNYFEVGDKLTAKYAYLAPARGLIPVTVVDYQTTGWKYLEVTEADTTDRSATTFNDSAWPSGQGAWANIYVTPEYPNAGFPTQHTALSGANVGLWVRKTVTMPANTQVALLNVRRDGNVWVYWDGVLLGTPGDEVNWPADAVVSYDVPTAPGTHYVAVRVLDDAWDPVVDGTYLDVQVIAQVTG